MLNFILHQLHSHDLILVLALQPTMFESACLENLTSQSS